MRHRAWKVKTILILSKENFFSAIMNKYQFDALVDDSAKSKNFQNKILNTNFKDFAYL